ncbi:unnamed protein product (macronuclear) [Paramecium tetraurelia]|uniref:Myb-like domain-containing protein n=1 Tax=Paramecium tetraurelia TaxID=5888 RepID=A0CHL1_PARTE|nr:uncharacterized protein GSPATT00038380001 [Paramecium tetraurelia]CAK70278.1 unnamed protein product [Paramecium tetraurelia]|eukprot:XP_001437675.1 hypothetical protein (macronuclear) [Paramecium tetraurelia strain d4-2]
MSLSSSDQQGIYDSGELSYPKSPKSKKIKKCESLSPKKNSGHWTQEEHQKYLKFLEDHAHIKKNNKIFKPMSDVIGTRSPSQCRSHHQKFNPFSPIVQKKNLKAQQRTQFTIPPPMEDSYQYKEEECLNRRLVQLMIFDEEEQFDEPQQFNLDDFF